MIDDNGPGVVTLRADDRALAVAAVKAVLRVASEDEDDLIAAFAESALGLAEQFTGQLLIARTLRETLSGGAGPGGAGWQRLGAAPVSAITAVEGIDGTPFEPSVFAIDIDTAADGWVRVAEDTSARVVFDAGLAPDWPALPAPLRQGVVLLAAYLFDARDALGAPPVAVTALWRPFRRVTLGGARRC
ncbi:head-tail connector protein [Sphingomonas sp. PAMC 26605]|uniref:head-tail connector protein n=1 Tax=Sphingomonas sp. PAMC 26605 TaxID=1112214 RepID=UPI00026CA21C|nr:hypothetical protein [Sphingomonas sp. PAMC 26605]